MQLRGYEFVSLLEFDLQRLIEALDYPEIKQFVGDPAERYPARLERERQGESLTLVALREQELAGTVGIFGYPGYPAALQTATILTPSFFGTGLNRLARVMQWELASLLGRPIVASIDADNGRSLAATRKLHPGLSGCSVFEPWFPRQAVLFKLTEPPVGEPPLAVEEREALIALVYDLPLWKSLNR